MILLSDGSEYSCRPAWTLPPMLPAIPEMVELTLQAESLSIPSGSWYDEDSAGRAIQEMVKRMEFDWSE